MFNYIIWDINPLVFPSFAFLRWYSLFWVLGILSGYQLVLYIFKQEKLPVKELDALAIYVVLGAILGARLGHVIFYEPVYYWNNPIEILPISLYPHFRFTGFAGLASHGGIIGVLIALFFYRRKYKRDYLFLLDRLSIAGALLGGCIRLGNLMNSEIIGLPTSVPWAFVFTRVDQLPRHPAQLYEAIFYFFIFIALFMAWKSTKAKNYSGLLFGLAIILVFIQRFFVEFFKENQVAFEDNLYFNMGQVLSIPMILIGVFAILYAWYSRNRRMEIDHG